MVVSIEVPEDSVLEIKNSKGEIYKITNVDLNFKVDERTLTKPSNNDEKNMSFTSNDYLHIDLSEGYEILERPEVKKYFIVSVKNDSPMWEITGKNVFINIDGHGYNGNFKLTKVKDFEGKFNYFTTLGGSQFSFKNLVRCD